MSAAPITVTPADLANLEAIADRVDATEGALRAEIARLEGVASAFRGALRETVGHIAAAQRDLSKTGLAQPFPVLDALLEEISERVAAAYGVAGIALATAEMRVDLDGRDDVTVLAEARERLGRRA